MHTVIDAKRIIKSCNILTLSTMQAAQIDEQQIKTKTRQTLNKSLSTNILKKRTLTFEGND
jgi:hypothetical protein